MRLVTSPIFAALPIEKTSPPDSAAIAFVIFFALLWRVGAHRSLVAALDDPHRGAEPLGTSRLSGSRLL